MTRAKKGNKVYLFDIKTGITKIYDSQMGAARDLGLKNGVSIRQGLDRGDVLAKRYVVKASKFTKREKDELYAKYWTKRPNDLITERWREIRPNVYVSTLGRAKHGESFVYPMLWSNDALFILIDGKKLNLRRLIAEAFIVKRELKKGEIVCLRGGILSYAYTDLYVATRTEIHEIGVRTRSIEVGLLGDDGEVLEVYKSISEAARANYIDKSSIAAALREGRLCYGLKFEYMDKIYK